MWLQNVLAAVTLSIIRHAHIWANKICSVRSEKARSKRQQVWGKGGEGEGENKLFTIFFFVCCTLTKEISLNSKVAFSNPDFSLESTHKGVNQRSKLIRNTTIKTWVTYGNSHLACIIYKVCKLHQRYILKERLPPSSIYTLHFRHNWRHRCAQP